MTLRLIAGIVVGGLLGLGYQKVAGCSTGACPITSNPWISSIYGMIIGALVAVA